MGCIGGFMLGIYMMPGIIGIYAESIQDRTPMRVGESTLCRGFQCEFRHLRIVS